MKLTKQINSNTEKREQKKLTLDIVTLPLSSEFNDVCFSIFHDFAESQKTKINFIHNNTRRWKSLTVFYQYSHRRLVSSAFPLTEELLP